MSNLEIKNITYNVSSYIWSVTIVNYVTHKSYIVETKGTTFSQAIDYAMNKVVTELKQHMRELSENT